jgi:hypothetical protein
VSWFARIAKLVGALLIVAPGCGLIFAGFERAAYEQTIADREVTTTGTELHQHRGRRETRHAERGQIRHAAQDQGQRNRPDLRRSVLPDSGLAHRREDAASGDAPVRGSVALVVGLVGLARMARRVSA